MPEKKPALLGKRARRDHPEEPSLSDADAAALDEFCAGIDCDGVSLEEWQNCHSRLDLSIPTSVVSDIASQGGEIEVCYSRTVRAQAGSRPVREKVRLSVKIPAGTCNGTRIRLVGHGDLADGHAGDLEIVIRVSSVTPETAVKADPKRRPS